jgi:YesN/AraC family two-component response regulator
MRKILVIAKPTAHRDGVLAELEGFGFQVFSTSKEQIGIEYAQQHHPSVILGSAELSHLNDNSLLQSFHENPETASLPFIVMTTQLTYSDFRQAMELGASDYLVEPFGAKELKQAIAIQLKKQSALEQRLVNQLTLKHNKTVAIKSNNVKQVQSSIAHPNLLSEVNRFASAPTLRPPLNKVFQYIESNYYRPITLGDVAKEIGYSPAYLTNLTRQHTGQTIQRWIIERRMLAAQQLLIETDQIVEKIATQVGYQHTVHFFRQFRQFHGTTPQTWRSLNRSHL